MSSPRDSSDENRFPAHRGANGHSRGWREWLPPLAVGTLLGSLGSIGYSIFEGGRGVERLAGEVRYLSTTLTTFVAESKQERDGLRAEINSIKQRQDSDYRLFLFSKGELESQIAVLKDRQERGR